MVTGERFVPQRSGRLVRDLAALPWGDAGDADRFRSFAQLVAALYHYEFHEREQRVIDAWEATAVASDRPLTDRALPGVEPSVGSGAGVPDPEAARAVTAELTGLLDGANYEPVTMAELDDALSRESLIPLRLEVDLDDYDEVLIYRRGSHLRTVTIPRWRGLRQEDRTITVDERVVVHTRVKPADWFDHRGIDAGDRNLVPGHVSLKQFQNVPRADIEMLLPSTQVRFRPIDTLLVGIPALASGIAVLTTKLLPTIGLIALLVAAGLGLREEAPELDQTALVVLLGGAITLGGFLFRQWAKLKNRRVEYLKTLSENLYFRTLADGPGVLHTLLSAAEQQETIEAVLAYRFLLAAPAGTTIDDLDRQIEEWLRETCQRDIDFEVDDAVAKLRRLDAVAGTDRLQAVPLDVVLSALDRRWDDLFRFHPDGDGPAGSGEPGADGATAEAAPHSAARGSRLIRLRMVVDRFTGRVAGRRSRREGAEVGAS